MMIEYRKCSADECYWHQLAKCPHGTITCWEPHHTLSRKVGPVNGALARVTDSRRRKPGQTGNTMVMTVDTDTFQPWMTDDEQAAFKIGGLQAVHKIKKAKARAAKRLPAAIGK